MQITKQKLREIIIEELRNMEEKSDVLDTVKGIGSSDMATQAKDMAKQTGADAKEKAVVAKLSKSLMAASRKTNIRSGKIGALLSRLFDELKRVVGEEKPSEV